MRKLFLFLLLLGAGLTFLYWLDRRGVVPVRETPEPAETRPQAGGDGRSMTFGGASKVSLYDEVTKRALLTMESKDSRTEGDIDHLGDVLIELFDPAAEDVVETRIRAQRARVKRLPSTEALQPRWEWRVELEGVQAQLLSGVPLAPLSFQTATAVVDATDPKVRRVSTDEEFTARSPDLTIDGRGLYCELDRGLIEIRQRGRVELRRENVTPATLAATGDGPLQVRREPGTGNAVTLEAWKGALLELAGENPGRLVAEHVALRASSPATGRGGELVIERLDADGGVDWTSGDSVFQGERATATFGAGGRLERARLDGFPRAELVLKEFGQLAPDVLPDVNAKQLHEVTVTGKDALDIVWKKGGFELSLTGQSSVEAPEFRLRSNNGLEGFLAEDRRSARFSAGGGVVVESGGTTLETVHFDVAIGSDEKGEARLEGTASGGPRLVGRLPAPGPGQDGLTFTLTSPDDLKIVRSALGWRVVQGTRVEVSLDGPDGFRARADRVQDFDVSRLAFVAEGGVVFEKLAGRMVGRYGGERLEVLAVEPVPHLILTGTADKKAFYSGEYGEASALRVEQTGGSLHAVGAVAVDQTRSVSGKNERVQFTADELTFDRSEGPELLPGERLRTLRTVISGNVQGNVQSEGQTLFLNCDQVALEARVRVVADVETPLERGSLLIAEGNVRTDVLGTESEVTIECERLEVERTEGDLASGFRQVVASGNVRFQGHKGMDMGGSGEVLVLDADRRGTLEANPYERVTLFGTEPSRNLPFRLTAERVDFEVSEKGDEHIHALRPELRMAGLRSRAEDLLVDVQVGVELSGGVRSTGQMKNHEPFTLDAQRVVIVGRRKSETSEEPSAPAGTESVDELDALLATGAVDFRLAEGLRARGDRLTARRLTGIVRLEGAPASFELSSARLETEWVEFDPTLQILVGTGSGSIRAIVPEDAPQAQAPSWTLDFLSSSTLLELDSLVLVIQEPVFRTAQLQTSLRASWAVLWLNREGLQDSTKREELLKGLKEAMERVSSLSKPREGVKKAASLTEAMKLFRSEELSGLLREVYFEGPVEIVTQGELVARADAVYLDAAQQHGWLARATVNMSGEFIGQSHERLTVKADWLRLSSDASLRADQATVTSCTFDEPHVRVVTGDLRITPVETKSTGKEHYRLVLKDNRIELYDLLKIPLPTIDIATDEELDPLWPTLSLANSARFGTLFSFAVTRPADNVGALANSLVGRKSTDVDAHYKIDGSYLGSRGGLLDLGVEIEGKDEYWLDLFVGLALDNGEDRGFIRVPEDERSSLRRWIRSRGYFRNGKSAWSFSYTDQSDPGVQSEFFERQFLRYERAETYLQWRRSSDEYFLQGTAKMRVDGFRSDVEELPSLGAYRGRSPLVRLGNLSLVHTGDVRAEYLQRREGSDPKSPFADPTTFPDGLGDREVLRFDTTQALELPLPLGAGWKLTPFVSGQASAWSEGVDPDDSPTRVVTEGGARLGTTFWKRTEDGKLHQIAPFIELRTELSRNEEDGIPVAFDSLESQISGDFLKLGTRTRLWRGAEDSLLDIDLVGTYASDRSDGQDDGWLPIETFSRLVLRPYRHEFEVFYDARYDIENSETDYSLVSLGTHLGEEWGIQASHQRGLDLNGDPLFEAASVSGLYRWTEKWEFEARESFSLLENLGLDSRFGLRRYGHDIVFELETSVREGEGSSFGISVRPRFGYHPSRVGYVPW